MLAPRGRPRRQSTSETRTAQRRPSPGPASQVCSLHCCFVSDCDVLLWLQHKLVPMAIDPPLYLALRTRLWAGPGQLRPPLNINALRVNLVNIDIVGRSQAKPDQDRTWSLKSQTRLGVSRHRLRQYWSLATQTGRLGALRPRPRQDLEFPDPD